MVVLNSQKDAYIRNESPNTNYNENRLIVCGYPSSLRRSFLEFDISSITVADITIAKLMMYCRYVSNNTNIHYTQRVTSAWTETGVTWNNQPTITTTNQASLTVDASILNTWVEWDITSLLKDESGTTLGLRIVDSNENDATLSEFSYWSRTGTHIPYIAIDNDYYIKTTGNDALDGFSWANAWATIDKAATTALDGSTVHIEHGEYSQSAALKVAPQNAGTLGIKYKPEPVGGGDTAATVKVTMT